jgi:hypothetical protein
MPSPRPDLRLDWCSHDAAKYACERWHYARTLPASKTVKIGAWENGSFIGSVIFSRGTCGHLFNRFGLPLTEGCELTRIALTHHVTPVSRILSVALRMLHGQSPGLRLIVSFAARSEGHHGGIYQASGWIYDGETAFKQEYAVAGRRITDRTVSEWVRQRKLHRSSLVRIPTQTKHRYLMPLDAAMRARIAPLAQPYPKRVKQATAGHHPVSDGAAPIHTLQSVPA